MDSPRIAAPQWPLEKVAVMLMTRRSKTEAGRRVQAAALARVEIAMAIRDALVSL